MAKPKKRKSEETDTTGPNKLIKVSPIPTAVAITEISWTNIFKRYNIMDHEIKSKLMSLETELIASLNLLSNHGKKHIDTMNENNANILNTIFKIDNVFSDKLLIICLGTFGVSCDDMDSYTNKNQRKILNRHGVDINKLDWLYLDTFSQHCLLAKDFPVNSFHKCNDMNEDNKKTLALCAEQQRFCLEKILEIRKILNKPTVAWTLSNDAYDCVHFNNENIIEKLESKYLY
jgi:hypothetical protein